LFLVPVAAALLAGCTNLVTSPTPWFTTADETGAPLRSGLWTDDDGTSGTKCRFDQRKPVGQWPNCAMAFAIRGHEQFGLNGGATQSDSRTFLLAAGEPRIEQIEGCPEPPRPKATPEKAALETDPAPASSPTPDEAENRPNPKHRYCFAAVKPVAMDNHNQIIAYDIWFIVCGPLHTSPTDSSIPVTDTPFSGLHVDGYDCTADDVRSLRNAAASTAVLLQDPLQEPNIMHGRFRWVRNSYR
jgi:hypothetical protein